MVKLPLVEAVKRATPFKNMHYCVPRFQEENGCLMTTADDFEAILRCFKDFEFCR